MHQSCFVELTISNAIQPLVKCIRILIDKKSEISQGENLTL